MVKIKKIVSIVTLALALATLSLFLAAYLETGAAPALTFSVMTLKI